MYIKTNQNSLIQFYSCPLPPALHKKISFGLHRLNLFVQITLKFKSSILVDNDLDISCQVFAIDVPHVKIYSLNLL